VSPNVALGAVEAEACAPEDGAIVPRQLAVVIARVANTNDATLQVIGGAAARGGSIATWFV
jgi:hypothetical protein